MALGLSKVSGTVMSSNTVGTSSTVWGTALNAGAGERYQHLVFQVSVTFNASATGDAVIHARKSADDGTTDDNLKTAFVTIEAPSTTTPQVVSFEVFDGDYIEIGVENQDTTYSLTATVKYEGVKITGMS